MMKINKIINGTSSIPNSNKNEKQELCEIDFKKLLKDASAKLVDVKHGISSPPSGDGGKVFSRSALPVSSLNGLLNLEDIGSVRSQGIHVAENTLKVLEQYQDALANPEISLRKVDQLVQSLSQEVDLLRSLSEQISISDPLHKIMTEVGIVSSVEIERFHRGEYL